MPVNGSGIAADAQPESRDRLSNFRRPVNLTPRVGASAVGCPFCGTPAVCGLDRRAPTLVTATDQGRSAGRKSLVIVAASGMVGGYALRYALPRSRGALVARRGPCGDAFRHTPHPRLKAAGVTSGASLKRCPQWHRP